MPNTDGWSKSELFVIEELKRLSLELGKTQAGLSIFKREMLEHYGDLKADIKGLNVKAGIWGTIAGVIPASIGFIILYIRSKLHD